MNCNDFLDILSGHDEHNIKAADFVEHRANCEDCDRKFDLIRAFPVELGNSRPTTPVELDTRILNAFQDHHTNLRRVVASENTGTSRFWNFPIPAFGFGLILFGIVGVAAFQLGRLSATPVTMEVTTMSPSSLREQNLKSTGGPAETFNKSDDTAVLGEPTPIKIVEKIVRVPVYRDRIVKKVVYVERKSAIKRKSSGNQTILNNSIGGQEFRTRTNLKDFAPVKEIKPVITKSKE